ncbi:MAG: F0F1 ATP synthase subunit gamma [Anaerolineaceae bacterium]|nr:F0F1 ATP synthase subunit gamma [Anaerolineaceae bacterium]
MGEGKERAKARLENLEAIEPLISSLRVLSLSTMQMAMNRQKSLDEYAARFNEVADQVIQMTGWEPSSLLAKYENGNEEFSKAEPYQVLAVIGSTRGIVGQYNKNLARLAKEFIAQNDDLPVRIVAFGKRIHPIMRQEGLDFAERDNLSTGSLPDYDVAATLIREWSEGFENGDLKKVSILAFQRNEENHQYEATISELLPGKMEAPSGSAEEEEKDLFWPPPIVEGEPKLIFEQIESHMIAIHFYRMILDSVAAENMFRFRLLEEAKENTSKLLEELSLEVQANRRKEITQQLQELLVGSGMLAQR